MPQKKRNQVLLLLAGLSLMLCEQARSEDRTERMVTHGTIAFVPSANEKDSPACYRMSPFTFSFESQQQKTPTNVDIDVFDLRFPSQVTTDHVENNTVHAEYYRPRGAGPFPGVIVLGIL